MDGLRKARPGDATAVGALAERAYDEFSRRIGGPPEPVGADYARLIADAIVYVLPRDADLVASLTLKVEADHLLVWSVAVDPAAQGRGIGRRLMAVAEDEARAQNRGEIRLYTNGLMGENLALYASLGYGETHRTPHPRLPVGEVVHMVKVLSGC